MRVSILPIKRRAGRRALQVAVVVSVSFFSCVVYRSRPTPITDVSLAEENLVNRSVRATTTAGRVTLKVSEIAFPFLVGKATGYSGLVTVDAQNSTRIDSAVVVEGRVFTRGDPMPWDQIAANPDLVIGKTIRIRSRNGDAVLRNVSAVQPPFIRGEIISGTGPVRVDLREVSELSIGRVDAGRTVLWTVVGAAATVGAAALIVALTKESCPFVYIDRGDGWELVGEAYPGAAFRSTQRDDMLALPPLANGDTVRILVRNEARETQYTDRAGVVVAEHANDVRALATHAADIVLVSAAHTATSAHDNHGRDATAAVRNRDDVPWVTQADMAAGIADDALEDVLTADFELPRSPGRPVLELVAGNTPWLDLVFGRFFAAMGDRLPTYLDQGNAPEAGPRIARWRRRERVDLIVEIENSSGWRPVAVVPTVGPAALREIAVPLPADAAAHDRLRVRLRGGLGFWRVDRLAISREASSPLVVHRVSAQVARGEGGTDERASVLATDGRYNVLSRIDESLALEFVVPPPTSRTRRTAFLFTNGYYNVHEPIQSRWSPIVLKRIRDEPHGLSRFGRDLARSYRDRLAATPRIEPRQLVAQ